MDAYLVEKYFFIFVLINILLLAYASYILNQYVYNWYILGIVIAIFINLLTISNHLELSTFTFIIIYGLVSIIAFSNANPIIVTTVVLSIILLGKEFFSYGSFREKGKGTYDSFMGIAIGAVIYILYMYILDLAEVNIDPNQTSSDDEAIIEKEIQDGNNTHRCALYQNNEFVRYL